MLEKFKELRHPSKEKIEERRRRRLFPPLPETLPIVGVINDLFEDGSGIIRYSVKLRGNEIGYADLVPLSPSSALFLAWIKIKSDYQGKTYGTQLLGMVQDDLRANNSVGILQDITPSGTESIYEKNGWQKIDGTKIWRSYNAYGLSNIQLRKIVEDGAQPLIDYDKAVRNKFPYVFYG